MTRCLRKIYACEEMLRILIDYDLHVKNFTLVMPQDLKMNS